jgi:hypothetical protein
MGRDSETELEAQWTQWRRGWHGEFGSSTAPAHWQSDADQDLESARRQRARGPLAWQYAGASTGRKLDGCHWLGATEPPGPAATNPGPASHRPGGAPPGQLQTGRDELRNVGHVAFLEQVRGTGLGVSGRLTGREIPGAAPEVQRS